MAWLKFLTSLNFYRIADRDKEREIVPQETGDEFGIYYKCILNISLVCQNCFQH